MSKVTSKLQLTVPKAIADQYHIRPGDELEWMPAGESIRVEVSRDRAKEPGTLSLQEKLELFDRSTERLCKVRQSSKKRGRRHSREGRGWTREELYDRGRPR